MASPTFTLRQLLESGVHFGHHTRRWNPKMDPYIFGVRNGVHIIDLQQTVPLLHRALEAAREVVAGGGRVLFVGTKRQAQDKIADAAKRCGQYYVNHRWLGGMLTNWKTISQSIKRLKEMDEMLSEAESGLTKKERLGVTRERDKLERALGGIRDMGGLPDILFVIDTNKESIAVQEATKLNIPVIAVIDSNSDPDGITYPIPGNDDALRAIDLYCELISASVLSGIEAEMMASGADIGESEAPVEPALAAETEQAAKVVPAEDAAAEAAEDAAPAEATGDAAPAEATGDAAPAEATGDAAPAEASEDVATAKAAEDAAPAEDAAKAAEEASAEEAPAEEASSEEKAAKAKDKDKPVEEAVASA